VVPAEVENTTLYWHFVCMGNKSFAGWNESENIHDTDLWKTFTRCSVPFSCDHTTH
jgi:hypothetical protein